METKVGPSGPPNAIVPHFVDLPEPSRAVEFMLEFSKLGKPINDELLALERPAEFTGNHLPSSSLMLVPTISLMLVLSTYLAVRVRADFWVTVWELPAGSSCYIFAVCDGYDSKLAIPNDAALAQVLFSPREYLNGNFLHETCTSVYAPNNQGHDVRSKLQHIRDSIHSQLDDRSAQSAQLCCSECSLCQTCLFTNSALPVCL